jgi:hypothetical protein
MIGRDMTTPVGATDPAVDGVRPAATDRANLVLTLLAAWFTAGLLLDAWAHNNVPELESFFTPWHAVFYSGFSATAGWILWTARAALGQRRWDLVPRGYGSSLVALVVFAIAAVGDLTWHTVFGIEQSIDILFSPTHLLLVAAMFVIVTTPVRVAWGERTGPNPGWRRLLPALGSTALATTLILLFLQYANVLAYDAGDVVGGLSDLDEGWTAGLVSSMAVTTIVLMAPLLALARRWVLPFGTTIILYAAAASLSGAVTGFGNAELLIGLVVAGAGVDLLGRALRPTADRPVQFRAFAALSPLLTWTAFIATAYATAPPIHSPGGLAERPSAVVELYTGAPIVQALIGLLLGILLTLDHPASRGQGSR